MEKLEKSQISSPNTMEFSGLSMASQTPPAFQLKASSVNTEPNVQVLTRNNYPWSGVICNTPSEALKSQGNGGGETLADIPQNTNVRVLGHGEGGWLHVEVDSNQPDIVLGGDGKAAIQNGKIAGYVSEMNIDAATAHSMQGMLGREATWIYSGLDSPTDFASYAQGPSSASVPEMGESTKINCWEVVLLAALNQGLIDHAYLAKLYAEEDRKTWPGILTGGELTYYDEAAGIVPQRGDLVFFNYMDHVALAASSNEVYSFWPKADPENDWLVPHDPDGDGIPDDANLDGVADYQYGEFIVDGQTGTDLIPTPDTVEKVTIAEMLTRFPFQVSFGPPAW